MGIFCENANFLGIETDFPHKKEREKNVRGEKKAAVQKEKKKKEAPVLVLHRLPIKPRAHSHVAIAHLGH